MLLEDPESTCVAYLFSLLMPTFITATVIIVILETQGQVFTRYQEIVMEIGFHAVFLADIMLRFWTCPNRLAYCVSPFNWIDLGEVIVTAVWMQDMGKRSDGIGQAMFCFLPVLRLLKTLRYFQSFLLLLGAFKIALDALPVLLFTLGVITLFFTYIIFVLEEAGDINTLPNAAWFTLVTMTTVGYGDLTPQTQAGRNITMVLLVFGVFYMAIPLGMIGQAFNDIWKDRHSILLVQRTRRALVTNGYAPEDVAQLFKEFDANGNGEVDLDEFREMVIGMRVGLNLNRIDELFSFLDADGSEAISDREFVKGLFPKAYHEIYGGLKKKERVMWINDISTLARTLGKMVNPTSTHWRGAQRLYPQFDGDKPKLDKGVQSQDGLLDFVGLKSELATQNGPTSPKAADEAPQKNPTDGFPGSAAETTLSARGRRTVLERVLLNQKSLELMPSGSNLGLGSW